MTSHSAVESPAFAGMTSQNEYALLVPRSSLLTPHSSLLTPHSSLLTPMKYLHAMIRVHDLDATSKFFTEGLGLRETRRIDNPAGKFTLVYFGAPANPEAEIELTYNWPA